MCRPALVGASGSVLDGGEPSDPERDLFGNIPLGTPEPTVWPLQNAALYTLIWVVIIIAIFAPLAVGRYQKAHTKS